MVLKGANLHYFLIGISYYLTLITSNFEVWQLNERCKCGDLFVFWNIMILFSSQCAMIKMYIE